MVKARLLRSDVERDSSLMWNALIFDVIGGSELAPRTEIQQCARDCFYYDGEIQNGGHFQFFENNGLEHALKVLDSLEKLGLLESWKLLFAAYKKAKNHSWGQITSVAAYVEAASEEAFHVEDNAHYALNPSLLDLIQTFAAEHPEEFFEIVSD